MRFSDPFGWVWGLATGVAPSHVRSPMHCIAGIRAVCRTSVSEIGASAIAKETFGVRSAA